MILPQNKNLYPTCRICRSDEPNSFIAPCKCKGTVKYVHRTCLMQWRKRLVSNGSNRRELDTCTLCNFRYIVKQNSKFGNVMTRLDIRFIITCIIILIMLLPSGYIMKLIISLTSKLYLRDVEINNVLVCSTLTKSSTIILKDFYNSLITTISDKDFWIKVMCNDTIQHLCLGLFFLGSVSNIVTAYFVIDELLDLFHQQQLQQQQHQQQQQQFLHDNFEYLNKKFILWGCCAVVTSLWFHYSLSSLKVTTNQEEFPLLILRWVTISMAVLDFGLRRIFWQLSKINFDDGEVLSIQKIDFNEL
ncbi:uncharacterized protein OCT59_029781 [Rhizophagus irregularis]|uniref:E3 ubiquitin-protein ligase SSM4 n=2 Tax=Rhizophagus irregularis TaxID=588596 RepID=A0A015K7G3_RHIIW|nr:hypothetical protein GLOIN_2v1621531 [Rhizophagus irregularis DAOM 181602=DAOM 197198]EXX75480.1 E3 ubiquitin-protein ligase SSM4 [Rhizophagus irregularis DAOM 197198w]UZO09563.1 hypothetical protein OCT59_029781 [Rhizophagus irregularis]EXX75481.1 E3 ubiquitin-protein ligase SSM4 [Rhizophagus irregularis DAOM 197198w]POG69984.1 hypothetical protein GLOIN_2v1621531 [Rhizophagus irregularis DAOM 181602=DAOM 197198]GBC48566.2 E3 ubiquitin-protein ligase MARCH8 [Rhizophagus irregularis DAOM 18|eukprot:XP_025176850.1 hypothetical protein GLOIN_2v1621531 [Rhizophagus irregularis DAOM 181602=DAOM 197198]